MIRMTVAGQRYGVEHVVFDLNGTIAHGGVVAETTKRAIDRLADDVRVHVVTADTFGSAREQLSETRCHVRLLESEDHTREKASYLSTLDGATVAVGNGANDVAMLDAADLGIAIVGPVGCGGALLTHADIVVVSIEAASGLLSEPEFVRATMRT